MTWNPYQNYYNPYYPQGSFQQLQLAQATSGMLRFPNSWSYGAGPFPPIFGGCGNAV